MARDFNNRDKERESRAAEAQKHTSLMNLAFSDEIKASVESARIFEQGEARDLTLEDPQFEKTDILVKRGDAVYSICNTNDDAVVLDFASFVNPGGGYNKGAWAQEEALCAESNLFNVLLGLKESYYDKNRQYFRGGLFSDRAMLLKDIQFSHGTNKTADVVVIAAPNKFRALRSHRSERECDAELARRVEAAMNIAACSGKPVAVLGAFGCGVFGNDPKRVATLFKRWLELHPGIFKQVIFAIPGGPNLDAFDEVFETKKPEVAEKPEVKEEEDEDKDDEWRSGVSQTSDGRWVFE